MEQHSNYSWSYDGPPPYHDAPFNHGGGGGGYNHHRRFHNNNNNYHDFNDDSFGYSNGPAFSGRKRPFSHFAHPPPEYFDDDGRSNKLYVSSVPREVTEEDIHSLFGKHGTITEVVLFKQLKNLQQHDCCFVKYATIEDATQAIEALHNQYTFPGRLRPIEVRYATKKPERPGPGFLKTHENKFFGHENKVFVGSLNKYASKAEIAAIFSPYGFVENVFLNYDEQRQCRGTGFITFSDRAMAADAINGLNGKYVMKGCDQPLVVRFAEPKKPRVWENRYPPYFNDPVAQTSLPNSSQMEGSEEDDASVALISKRDSPTKLPALSPKTPAAVDHETGSNVSPILSGVEANQSKEVGLTKSSGTKSLDENQGPVIEQPGLAGKQNVQLNKDKLPNENTGQDLHVQRTWVKKSRSKRKGKRGKRRTISINAEPRAQVFGADSQDASKEKADGRLEKDLTTEASVGKSMDTMPDDQPISRWFEGEHSPTDGPEGTVEQSSKASEGRLDLGNLPFIKSTALWKTLESMEAFRIFPQKPHFRPLLEGVREGAQEGLAIGTMVTFSTMVDKACNLRIDYQRSKMEDCLETIAELENNGFDVEVIRERLTGLLLIKDKKEELEEQSKGVVEKIEENNTQGKRIEEEIEEISRQMRQMEERMKQALLKKEQRNSETGAMEAVIELIKQEIKEAIVEFDGLAVAPFVE